MNRNDILKVVQEWEKEYYDKPTNNIQIQGYSQTITVHNGVGAVNPRSKFINKVTFRYFFWNGDVVVVEQVRKRRVATDRVLLNWDAIEKLRKKIKEALENV